jgi:hypothetical protein
VLTKAQIEMIKGTGPIGWCSVLDEKQRLEVWVALGCSLPEEQLQESLRRIYDRAGAFPGPSNPLGMALGTGAGVFTAPAAASATATAPATAAAPTAASAITTVAPPAPVAPQASLSVLVPPSPPSPARRVRPPAPSATSASIPSAVTGQTPQSTTASARAHPRLLARAWWRDVWDGIKLQGRVYVARWRAGLRG